MRLEGEEELMSMGNVYKRIEDFDKIMHDQQLDAYEHIKRQQKGLEDVYPPNLNSRSERYGKQSS